MYIRQGIAYAGESVPPIRVKSVIATEDYQLLLTFTNGERRVFDCNPLFAYPVFKVLRDYDLFRQAHVDHGAVLWNDELDYAPEALYTKSTPIE
jgi:hypothetical protein